MDIRALELVDRFYRYLETERRFSRHTVSAYRHDLAALVRFCEKSHIDDWKTIEVGHVRAFAAQSRARGLSASSIQRRLSTVRSFMKFLIREGVIGGNPAALVQGPKVRRPLPTVLDVDQMARLLNVHDPDPLAVRDRAIMELLYSSGLRLKELVGLDCNELSVADRIVRVLGKGNVTRLVPVGSHALKAIASWLPVRRKLAEPGETALFVARNGRRIGGRAVEARVSYWARRQGITVRVYPHIFRHSAATHLLESSGDIRFVQEFLGHASISTTQIYTHLDVQHLAKVYYATHPRAHRKGATWTTPATASQLRRSPDSAESPLRPPPAGNVEPRESPRLQP